MLRRIIIAAVLIGLYSISYCSTFFLNETTVKSDYESYYNIVAEEFKAKTGVNVYFYIFMAKDKDGEQIKEELDKKSQALYMSLRNTKIGQEKYMVLCYEILSGNAMIQKNYDDVNVTEKRLYMILDEYFLPHFDYMEMVLGEDGEIEKILSDRELAKDKQYINKTFSLAGINYIRGVSIDYGIKLPLPEGLESELKTRKDMFAKKQRYDAKIAKKDEEKQRLENQKRVEQDLKRQQIADQKRKAEEEKIKKTEEDKRKQEEEERKIESWKQGIKGSISFNYIVSELKGEDSKNLDPVTGLPKEVYDLKKKSELTAEVTPFIKSPDNGEVVGNISYKSTKDYIADKEQGEVRFNYLNGKILLDSYTVEGRIGDIGISESSVVLSRNYRGFYSSLKYYMGLNPEKASYKNKILKKEIKKETKNSAKISLLFAPENGALGVIDESQKQTMGFLFDFTHAIDEKKYWQIGYVFGESTTTSLQNSAQEFVINGVDSLNRNAKIKNEEIPYTLYIDYSLSEFKSSKTSEATSGDRLYTKGTAQVKYGLNDYTDLSIIYNFTDPKFNTLMLSQKYDSYDVPTYVTDQTAVGQSGYNLQIRNTLWGQRSKTQVGYYDYKKTEKIVSSGETKVYPKQGLTLANTLQLFKDTSISTGYSNIIDVTRKEENYLGNVTQSFDLTAKDSNDDVSTSLIGKITPSYKLKLQYESDEKNYQEQRIGVAENTTLVLKKLDISDNNFIDMNNYNYKFSNEKVYNFYTTNDIFFSAENFYQRFGYTYYIKDNQRAFEAYNQEISKSLQIDNEFISIVTDSSKLRSNINMKHYSYAEKKNEIQVRDIDGAELVLFTPLKIFGINSYNTIDYKMSKDNIFNQTQSNLSVSSRNSKDLFGNEKLIAYTDLTYRDNKFDAALTLSSLAEFLLIQGSNINKESSETLLRINQYIASITDKMREENVIEGEVESGVKYLIGNKDDRLKVSIIGGAGYEVKSFPKMDKSYQNYLMALGGELKYSLDKEIYILEQLKWKPYFSVNTNEIQKHQYNNVIGLYVMKENWKNALSLTYRGEDFPKSKIENSESYVSKLVGEVLTNKKKTSLQYEVQNEYRNNVSLKTDIKMFNAKLKFKSNVYSNDSKTTSAAIATSPTEVKALSGAAIKGDVKGKKNMKWLEGVDIITRSDIFAEYEKNTNVQSTKDSEFDKVNTGGSLVMWNGWNTINTGGGWLKRKDNKASLVEEFANISVSDTQKVTESVNLSTSLSYDANISNASEMSDYKIMKFNISLNVNKLVLNNLSTAINYTKSSERYQEVLKKETNSGQITFKYSF